MIAAFLSAPKQLHIKQTMLPEPKAGEVRIRLTMIGVCGSDVHLYLGHRLLDKPTIIGHEGLGIIDKIGEGVTGRNIGERVVIEPNIPCRKCVYCYQGKGNICINKRVMGMNEAGCFAEYITLPADFAWQVPDSISDADAVTIEPMAVAVHALLAAKSKFGDTIAVIGLGAIGLLLTHLALSLGYKVYVSEISEAKLKIAEKMGAKLIYTEGASAAEQTAILAKTWLENGVSSVFECAGTAFTGSLATAAAPRGSEIVLVGLSAHSSTFNSLKIAREGITIVPSIIYDHPFDFQRTLNLIESKVVNPSFIISQYMPLANLEHALETAAKGEDSKIIITI
jgi:L-iditol 2-dehydrogenase